ncbi:MAG: AraC family transcriptional regulator [Opitutae bacterium]|nr:AraC family transcriptional regulator [Opitutae bacterium]
MNSPEKAWSCYLPQSPAAVAWGLYILDAGYTLITPNTPYPPGEHPDDHMFCWDHGRTLDSFTLVYITHGSGTFESQSGGKKTINAGDLFILYPGEWHRFKPNNNKGWHEHWVEFDGEQARRIMRHPALSPEQPVHSIGADESILRLFLEISEATQTQPPGFEQIIATQASQIVARLLARLQYSSTEDHDMETRIRRACLHILQHSEQTINTPQLSRDLGISHSAFRNQFKQVTGLPPGQYQIQIRLNKARRLLRNSTLSIQEIAEQLGFDSIYYFSRLFKKKTGCSPLAYRKQI